MLNIREFVKKGLIVIPATGITVLYYFTDPSVTSIGIPCLLKAVTGWQCWGCGGQRAFHQLLHGNFRQAFYLNALVFPIVILLVHVLLSELSPQPASYKWLRRNDVRILTALVATGFTVIRNLI